MITPPKQMPMGAIDLQRIPSRDLHSLEQVEAIENAVRHGKMATGQAVWIAIELVTHGSPQARDFLQILRNQSNHPDVLRYVERLEKHAEFIRAIPGIAEIQGNLALRAELYKLGGFFFSRGDRQPEKLIVVFTTMYNNFYLSNLVFYAFLKQFGLSILILKDCSFFNYLKGVTGLGNDIEQVTDNIALLARRERISDIRITGFSSGGYASFYAACLLPCSRYLGFSLLSTDFSKDSQLYPGKFFTDEVRSHIPEKCLTNLRQLFLARGHPIKGELYYGENSNSDIEHAKNLAGLPDLTFTSIPNCAHQSVAALMERGELSDCFRRLLA